MYIFVVNIYLLEVEHCTHHKSAWCKFVHGVSIYHIRLVAVYITSVIEDITHAEVYLLFLYSPSDASIHHVEVTHTIERCVAGVLLVEVKEQLTLYNGENYVEIIVEMADAHTFIA